MFPSQTQRFLMLCVLVLGTGWWWLVGGLTAADGAAALSLWDASGGPLVGAFWMALGGVVAVGLAVLISGTGNPLSGVFTLGMTLTLVAAGAVGRSGYTRETEAMQALFWRAEAAGGLGSVYLKLIAEAVCWMGVWVGVLFLLESTQRPMRRRLHRRLKSEHLGGTLSLVAMGSRSALAALVTAGIGSVLVVVLVPVSTGMQVIGGLVLAFTVAAMVGQLVAPQERPMLVLMMPGVVAIAGYAMGWVWYGRPVTAAGVTSSGGGLLAELYGGDLPGVMLALPVHYLSAGVVGCVVGIGLAQAIEKAKLHTLEA